MSKQFAGKITLLVCGILLGSILQPFRMLPSLAQGGCQTFTETGKNVCGGFLDYWKGHGGLAQQGFPISNEFSEVSELNGKTYIVQYFERAVFEKHPENAAPNDILLSQLGTFQFKRKYPGGDPSGGAAPTVQPAPVPPSSGGQEIAGAGTKVSDSVMLNKGLAVFHSVHIGTGGNFIVEMVDASGKTVSYIANEIGATDTAIAINIPQNGAYLFKVRATGDWKITITQPTGVYAPPPAQHQWSGNGAFVTPLFSLKAGALRVKATHANGTRNFIIQLLDKDGNTKNYLANEIGPATIETIVNIPTNGVYIITMRADGDWTLRLDQ